MDLTVKVYLGSWPRPNGWPEDGAEFDNIHSWSCIDDLKKLIFEEYGVPIESQHFYPGYDESQSMELGDMHLSSLIKEFESNQFTLMIKPTILTEDGLAERLPHVSATTRQKLLVKILKIKGLDEDTICEKKTMGESKLGAMILDRSTNMNVTCIIKGDQTLIPVSFNVSTKSMDFRPAYGYEYLVSTTQIEEFRTNIVSLESTLETLKNRIIQLKSSEKFECTELRSLLIDHAEATASLRANRRDLTEFCRNKPLPQLLYPNISVYQSSTVTLGLGVHTFGANSYEIVEIKSESQMTGQKRNREESPNVKEEEKESESNQVKNENDAMEMDEEDEPDEVVE